MNDGIKSFYELAKALRDALDAAHDAAKAAEEAGLKVTCPLGTLDNTKGVSENLNRLRVKLEISRAETIHY